MAKKQESVSVPIDRIQVNTYVRLHQDNDRVNYFFNLIQAGTNPDPIEVTDSLEIVDGRTRLAAYQLAGRKSIQVIKLGNLTPQEIIFRALQTNLGGAKPPTNGDLMHTIKQLLRIEVKRVDIVTKLESMGIPKKFGSQMLNNAQAHVAKEKVVAAAKEVRKGEKTAIDVAAEFKVDLNALKRELGERKRPKKSATEELGELKKRLSDHTQKAIWSTDYVAEKATTMINDTLLSDKERTLLIKHMRQQSTRFTQHIEKCVDRLEKLGK